MAETCQVQWRTIWVANPADHAAMTVKAFVEEWTRVHIGEEPDDVCSRSPS